MQWPFNNDPLFGDPLWNYGNVKIHDKIEEAIERLRKAKWRTALPVHPGPEPLCCVKPTLPKTPQSRMHRVQARG